MNQFANLILKKTPYNLKQLAEVLDASYSDGTNKTAHLQKTGFSASVIGYESGSCARRWVLAFRGADFVQEYDAQSVDNMQTGTDAHKRIQDNFAHSEIQCEIEHELRNEDPPLHGFVDLILKDFNGHNIVVEIKTTRSESFAFRQMNNAGPEYQVLQLLIYMELLGEKYGLLLYENKNDHKKLLIPVEMDEDNRRKVDKTFAWMRQVHQAYKDDLLPKNMFRSNAKICKECPVRQWCFDQPEGDIEIARLDYS